MEASSCIVGDSPEFSSRTTLFTCLAILMATTMVQGTLNTTGSYKGIDRCAMVETLQFDGQAANASVLWQVDLGPRLPGSEVSANLREASHENLTALGYEMTTQEHQRYDMNLTNLFARWSPDGTSSGSAGPFCALRFKEHRRPGDKRKQPLAACPGRKRRRQRGGRPA